MMNTIPPLSINVVVINFKKKKTLWKGENHRVRKKGKNENIKFSYKKSVSHTIRDIKCFKEIL